jgi:hypothetical protein
MTSRRQRFRDYMARVNGAAAPADAITQGFYIMPKDSVALRIATRFDLQPASTHLVVGGVGSGKTTQLLVACEALRVEHPGALAIYVDLSEYQDLDKLQPGSLLALAGLTLCDAAAPSDAAAALRQSFRRWATGWLDDPDLPVPEPVDLGMVWVPGVVTPPRAPLIPNIERRRAELGQFMAQAFAGRAPIVLLVDSLDRMSDLAGFQRIVEQDMAALTSLGIGLVLVGPLRVLYGLERDVTERFDYLYRQPAVDVAQDRAGKRFLFEILRQRAPVDILPDDACERLVDFSGGVLRDLLRLAHQAGDEAYVEGADRIEVVHVKRAADAFGRSLMLGLDEGAIQELQEIRATGRFVQTSEQDLALLITRRILDYQDASGELRYAVHPTLEPLLASMESKT